MRQLFLLVFFCSNFFNSDADAQVIARLGHWEEGGVTYTAMNYNIEAMQSVLIVKYSIAGKSAVISETLINSNSPSQKLSIGTNVQLICNSAGTEVKYTADNFLLESGGFYVYNVATKQKTVALTVDETITSTARVTELLDKTFVCDATAETEKSYTVETTASFYQLVEAAKTNFKSIKKEKIPTDDKTAKYYVSSLGFGNETEAVIDSKDGKSTFISVFEFTDKTKAKSDAVMNDLKLIMEKYIKDNNLDFDPDKDSVEDGEKNKVSSVKDTKGNLLFRIVISENSDKITFAVMGKNYGKP